MTFRLATTPMAVDQTFDTLPALASHIQAWRGERGLTLRQAEIFRDGRQDHAVSVYASDGDNERADQLGYVITGERGDVLLDRLEEALQVRQQAAA